MLLLREYRKIEKWGEYAELRKKILRSLHKDGWSKLCSLVLAEERKSQVTTDKVAVEFAIDLDNIAYSGEDSKVIEQNLKKFFDSLVEAKGSTEIRGYSLKSENKLVKAFVSFDKNSVGTYEETICRIRLCPLVTFPLPIKSITTNFTEPTFNRTLEETIELKKGMVKDYELSIYVKPGMPSTITFKNITITINE